MAIYKVLSCVSKVQAENDASTTNWYTNFHKLSFPFEGLSSVSYSSWLVSNCNLVQTCTAKRFLLFMNCWERGGSSTLVWTQPIWEVIWYNHNDMMICVDAGCATAWIGYFWAPGCLRTDVCQAGVGCPPNGFHSFYIPYKWLPMTLKETRFVRQIGHTVTMSLHCRIWTEHPGIPKCK